MQGVVAELLRHHLGTQIQPLGQFSRQATPRRTQMYYVGNAAIIRSG